jgi:hypothetical protein
MTLDDGATATVQTPRVDLRAGIALAEALRNQTSEAH